MAQEHLGKRSQGTGSREVEIGGGGRHMRPLVLGTTRVPATTGNRYSILDGRRVNLRPLDP